MSCWSLLERTLTSGQTIPSQLLDLSDIKVVPDARRVLTRPDFLYFEDRPGLALKFGDLIRNNIIPRYQNAWRAMEAAGVKPLSRAVRADLVECTDPLKSEDLQNLLHERRLLVARVASTEPTDHQPNLDLLNEIEFV